MDVQSIPGAGGVGWRAPQHHGQRTPEGWRGVSVGTGPGKSGVSCVPVVWVVHSGVSVTGRR